MKKLLSLILRKDRRLGVAEGKRSYDLPLSNDESTVFLALLIGLMSFLAIMAMSSSFALSSMTSQWSGGLENQATIEIPAQDSEQNGDLRSADEMSALQMRIKTTLHGMPVIAEIDILDEEDLRDLVSPWLGNDFVLNDLPLPGLISLKLRTNDEGAVLKLRETLALISPDLHLDTHERWLADLFRLSGALHFAAICIAMIIIATTVIAIAGAVQSRMAIYRADIELLHLMGARDTYIMRQFQRHALILAFKGAVIGTSIALLVLVVISWISGDSSSAAGMMQSGLSGGNMVMIFMLPIMLCVIAAVTTRHTVLRVLALMP